MIYSWLIDGLEHEQREKVDALLWEIPAGAPDRVYESDPRWDVEANGNAFMAQMGARGGAGRAQTGATMQGQAIKRV